MTLQHKHEFVYDQSSSAVCCETCGVKVDEYLTPDEPVLVDADEAEREKEALERIEYMVALARRRRFDYLHAKYGSKE